MLKITPKFQPKQQTPALTKNGNEYKPMRFGLMGGTIAGAAITAKVLEKDTFGAISKGTDLFKQTLEAKGIKDNLKAFSKYTGHCAAMGLAIASAVGLGAIIGNNLIDAPINQEKRDQADGEAVRKNAALNFEV
jgi:hypothetical protein